MCRLPEGCMPDSTRAFIGWWAEFLSYAMAPPQTNFELTIEKLVYGGEGLGRAGGHVVFVPYVLPGERVLVEPRSAKGGLQRALLREVLEPAAGRVDPPCPYFGHCGGCHYQHAAYELQL